MGWLTVAGIETLDPARFAVVCLVQNAAPTDAIARRFRAAARDWIEIDALEDVALATRARELGIDVLIDLGGYGDAARMPACAHRLAPVQVKWVGSQNHSTGLPEIDWFITDRWETPPELEQVYSEQLLRLPDGYVCYSPPGYAPDIGKLPALANGHITFGCFNNLAKVTPRVIATWAAVLHRVPQARLVLKTHQFGDRPTADRVRAAFAGEGIAAARIELRGSSGHRAFMGEYGQIDIVLDPFPYSGGLTTCEALWMGVPTVTLPGEIFASRHSMSHLSNAGLSDWVARDAQDYVALAVAKAADVTALAALRAGLRVAREGQPAVRRAALRPQPRRRVAACLARVVRGMNAFSSSDLLGAALPCRRPFRSRVVRSSGGIQGRGDQRFRCRQRDRRRAGPGLRRRSSAVAAASARTMSASTFPPPRWHVAPGDFRGIGSCRSPRWTHRSAPNSCCRST